VFLEDSPVSNDVYQPESLDTVLPSVSSEIKYVVGGFVHFVAGCNSVLALQKIRACILIAQSTHQSWNMSNRQLDKCDDSDGSSDVVVDDDDDDDISIVVSQHSL
jgi:hypothetical protein